MKIRSIYLSVFVFIQASDGLAAYKKSTPTKKQTEKVIARAKCSTLSIPQQYKNTLCAQVCSNTAFPSADPRPPYQFPFLGDCWKDIEIDGQRKRKLDTENPTCSSDGVCTCSCEKTQAIQLKNTAPLMRLETAPKVKIAGKKPGATQQEGARIIIRPEKEAELGAYAEHPTAQLGEHREQEEAQLAISQRQSPY